jgi:peptidoglycan/xylan/chitin deacetylase (PgdA/CDA1 family)
MISLKLRIIREKNRLYSWLLRILSYFQPHASVVYLFHDIVDKQEDVKTPFAISQTTFENFLLTRLEQGWKPLTYNEMLDIIQRKRTLSKNCFIISFDDANESVFTKAYPFLKKQGIPFIIFITRSLIGKQNYLSEEQIKMLAADPLCTVGSHGLNHVMFRYLSPEEMEQEYHISQAFLQELTGQSVKSFAFPYGRVVECSRKNIHALKHSVYDLGFSAISGSLNHIWLTGKYYIPRINVSEALAETVIND